MSDSEDELNDSLEVDLIGLKLKDFREISWEQIINCKIFQLHNNKLNHLHTIPKLIYLEELNLSSNDFHSAYLPELASALPNLIKLDLSGNSISSCEGFPYLPNLRSFSIAFNLLTSLQGLEDKLPYIEELDIRGNQLQKSNDLDMLENFTQLRILFIGGKNSNPVCKRPSNIYRLFRICESLTYVDEKDKETWRDIQISEVATPKLDIISERFRSNSTLKKPSATKSLLTPSKSRVLFPYEPEDYYQITERLPFPQPPTPVPQQVIPEPIPEPTPEPSLPEPKPEPIAEPTPVTTLEITSTNNQTNLIEARIQLLVDRITHISTKRQLQSLYSSFAQWKQYSFTLTTKEREAHQKKLHAAVTITHYFQSYTKQTLTLQLLKAFDHWKYLNQQHKLQVQHDFLMMQTQEKLKLSNKYQIEQLQQIVISKEKQCQEYKKQQDLAQEQINIHQETNNIHLKTIEINEKKLNELLHENMKLQSTIQQYMEIDQKTTNGKIEELEKSLQSIEKKYQNKKEELSYATTRLTTLTKQLQDSQQLNQSYQQTIDNNLESLQQHQQELTNKQQTIDQLTQQLQEYQQLADAFTSYKQLKLEERLTKLQLAFEEISQNNQMIQQENQTLHEKHSKDKKMLKEMANCITKLQEIVDVRQQQLKETKEIISQPCQQCQHAQEELQRNQYRFQQLLSIEEALKKENKDQSLSLQVKETMLKDQNQAIDKLTKSYQILQQDYNQLLSTYHDLQDQFQNNESQLHHVQDQMQIKEHFNQRVKQIITNYLQTGMMLNLGNSLADFKPGQGLDEIAEMDYGIAVDSSYDGPDKSYSFSSNDFIKREFEALLKSMEWNEDSSHVNESGENNLIIKKESKQSSSPALLPPKSPKKPPSRYSSIEDDDDYISKSQDINEFEI